MTDNPDSETDGDQTDGNQTDGNQTEGHPSDCELEITQPSVTTKKHAERPSFDDIEKHAERPSFDDILSIFFLFFVIFSYNLGER